MSKTVSVRATNGRRISVTVRDIELYIAGVAQSSTGRNARQTPYTSAQGTLSTAELSKAMHQLGYSKRQIENLISGNISGGGWIGDALQGLAGGLAAVGPAGLGLGDAIDAIAPEVSDTAGVVGDTAPADTAAGATAAGGGAGAAAGAASKFLEGLVSKYGSLGLLLPLLRWLTTGKNWVRILEFIGGAVMIGIAFRELAHE